MMYYCLSEWFLKSKEMNKNVQFRISFFIFQGKYCIDLCF